MKLYLDEDISPRVAEIARGRCQLDVVSVHDVGAETWDDAAQLRYAADTGRCIVTRNRDDFIRVTRDAFEKQAPHAGVLILTRRLPNDQFTAIAAALCAYAARFATSVQSYTIDFLLPADPA
jgi:predicted nuclease of predicted toxin-antitoxin system